MKVLIVDDDSIARTNIKTLISWAKYDFEISGEAANGAGAIQAIKNDSPDIVITDMSMPVMDGVALIEHIEKNYPGIKVIALSGYDDFDYVRQSMKNGAVDYLLKHKLTPGVLLNVLKTAREIIEKERMETAQKSSLQQQLSESRAVMRQNFIKQLVQGAISEKGEVEKKIEALELEISTRNLALVLAEMDDFQSLCVRYSLKEINKLISSVMDIAGEIIKDMGRALVSPIDGGRFVIIFSFGSMRSDLFIYNHIMTAVGRIKASIKRYLNITACFSLSKIFNDITEISRHYLQADLALQNRFFKGKDQIINEPVQGGAETEYLNLDINDEKLIIAALKATDRQKIASHIHRIFEKIIERKIRYKSIQMICAELINIINRVARETGIDIKTVYSDEDIPYDEMKKFETMEEVKQWILGVYEKMAALLEKAIINPKCSETTKKAVEYIQKNYAKNISLNDAANYIGVNSSYLSRTFKEECKKGFVEFLNNIRVDRAKSLMEGGNIKLKDVVKEVGFNNYTYFFKVFKDILNMTPLEYEEKCRKE